jgi:transglutaminase-like putative cysteine protease
LRDNAGFAVRNPKTAKLARELKADNHIQTVQNIRAWITKNMTYRYDPVLKEKETSRVGGTDAILQAKYGDCGGHSNLFVHLCRQAGVPARPIWGPVKIGGPEAIPKETGLAVDQVQRGDFCGHAWAEVFVKDWGWIPLEPQAYAHEVPLGRVPQYFVPFVRIEPSSARVTDAMLAVGNVWLMNYFARPEQPGDKTRPTKE